MPDGLTLACAGRYSHRVPYRFVLFLTSAVCLAQPLKNPLAGDADAVKGGAGFSDLLRSLPRKPGPWWARADLTRGSYSVGDRDEDLFRTIAHGIPGTGMQAFDDLGKRTRGAWSHSCGRSRGTMQPNSGRSRRRREAVLG